jgi:hypothetical protein
MIARLRAKLKSLREKLLNLIRKRHDAKPGGDRRKVLARAVRDAREEKEEAAEALAEAKKNRDKVSLKNVNVTSTPGAPHWGGGGDVVSQFVEPFMVKRGLPIGSGKRTPAYNQSIGGSPTSDHLTTHTTTMARDFPTYSGEDDARALAAAMGNKGWVANSYAQFYVTVDGRSFRVQILWGAGIGHGDHVHVGVGS